jgi:hypothetical protein
MTNSFMNDDSDHAQLMADDGPSVVDDQDDYEPGICPDCGGSGEGMTDGSVCRTCGGDGEV